MAAISHILNPFIVTGYFQMIVLLLLLLCVNGIFMHFFSFNFTSSLSNNTYCVPISLAAHVNDNRLSGDWTSGGPKKKQDLRDVSGP